MPFNNAANSLFRQKKVVNSAGSYVVLATDVIINITNTAAPRTVTLPAPSNSNVGKTFLIKDSSGGADTNNITVTSASGNIDGAANYVINEDYGSAAFYSDGSNYSIDNKITVPSSASPLTTGGVMFASGGQLTQDNPNFFWNNSTKRLGINTTTPTGAFQAGGFISMQTSSLALTTSFQQFTTLGNRGFYFVNCRHPNGDYFNFTCIVGLDPGNTFYFSISNSSDSGGGQIDRQGNLTNINLLSNISTRATIQSTGERIVVRMHNGTGEFRMKRRGAGPVGTINFQIIRLGANTF